MTAVFCSKDDECLTLIVDSDGNSFPHPFKRQDWELIKFDGPLSVGIAKEIETYGFVTLRNNLPIGTRTTLGLMPK